MMFNVPQFVDIEDKIIGPLGWKEILWMIGMVAVLFPLYGFLERSSFIVVAIPVAILFFALAFYKPYGQPLIKVLMFVALFSFRPKIYVWKREGILERKKAPTKKIVTAPVVSKKLPSGEELSNLAQILDEKSRLR